MRKEGLQLAEFDDIMLEAFRPGKDYLLVITGGVAHIGAASTAYFLDGEVIVSTSSVPGHKEDVISGDLAKKAARQLKATVTLVMGIHYDGLGREGIAAACARAEELLEEYIDSQQ